MIFITGDTHQSINISKLNTTFFPQQKNLTKNDYVIICGDFGCVWDDSNLDKYWQNWFSNKNFTTLFVDGNHENFNLLNKYPVSSWNGGKVHFISPSVIHLMRGQIFNINGINIFTMGGASSHDKEFRKENISWWKDEIPSDLEFQEAFSNLNKYNNKVDIIISHCCDDNTQNCINNYYEHDKLTNFFKIINESVDFKYWFFGHYHIDKFIDNKHRAVFNDVIPLKISTT